MKKVDFVSGFNGSWKSLKKINFTDWEDDGIYRRRKDFGGTHTATIYPPLSVFRRTLDPIQIEDIAVGIDSTIEVNLYIHNCLCEWSCSFCPYETKIERVGIDLRKKLVETLIGEIAIWKRNFEILGKELVLSSCYIGGGTGFLMSHEDLAEIIDCLNDIKRGNNFHFCIEASSSSLCRSDATAKLQLLKDNGLDRISIGVQTIDDELLRIHGRGKNLSDQYPPHLRGKLLTAEQIGDHAIDVAKRFVDHINIDLMQDLSDSYSLEILEKDLLWFDAHNLPSLTYYLTRYIAESRGYRGLIDPLHKTEHTKASIAMRLAVQNWLRERDFNLKAGGRFIKSGFEDIYKGSRSSPDEYIIGVGPSAYSRLDSHYFKNRDSLNDWMRQADGGSWEFPFHHFISENERAEGRIMHLVREGGRIEEFRKQVYLSSRPTENERTIESLLEYRLLQINNNRYELSEFGRTLEEEIIWLFGSEENQSS